MRLAVAAFVAVMGFQALPAHAYENFIPLGHNYAPDQPELPTLNSDEDQLNAQVDIYESEIYNRQRRAKLFSSQLDQFKSAQEFNASSDFIDY